MAHDQIHPAVMLDMPQKDMTWDIWTEHMWTRMFPLSWILPHVLYEEAEAEDIYVPPNPNSNSTSLLHRPNRRTDCAIDYHGAQIKTFLTGCVQENWTKSLKT